MPSYRVNEATLSLGVFDVVGQDGGEPGFIGHAGLAETAGSQDVARVAVLDMGPPLHGEGNPGRITASAFGSAALTDDEVRKIKTFIDRHANEHRSFAQLSRSQLIDAAPQLYCVCPHAEPIYEDDGRYARMRFSCAGFVFEAYKKARIQLLDLNVLPMVGMAVIRHGYAREVRLMTDGFVSPEDLGLPGDGPWPVLLCGYLFHALNRDGDAIRRERYAPSIADRHFK